jgi:hypothetical protein
VPDRLLERLSSTLRHRPPGSPSSSGTPSLEAAPRAGTLGSRAGEADGIGNLDGLANFGVVDSLTGGTLACYLRDMRIDYLMDFGYMFPAEIDTQFSGYEEERRLMLVQRNGYNPKALFRCVEIATGAPDKDVPQSTYFLFRLDRGRTAAMCEKERLRDQ